MADFLREAEGPTIGRHASLGNIARKVFRTKRPLLIYLAIRCLNSNIVPRIALFFRPHRRDQAIEFRLRTRLSRRLQG
ncbi:MAG TPA: hypothetical protein VFW87_00400, partial [Pirellulales bacterium]|nr:hypothetical protein [Pirellulales bacterium]